MQVLRFLLQPRTRWILSWLITLAAAGFIAEEAWRSYNDSRRGNANYGHATIDFGGQWLMGRTIVEGQGRHLYDRNYLRRLAQRCFPEAVEIPKSQASESASKSDAENLMDWMAGVDDPQTPKVLASFLSPLAANNPLDETTVLASAEATWTAEWLEHVTAPRIGGALYPPIHALYYSPIALFPPRLAYRVVQGIVLALVFFIGWMVERMTEGRVWWPVASLLVILFPGFTGCIVLGQNGLFTLTLALLGWWQLMRGREVRAGLCWALLAFKPVWAAAFFLVPLLTGRWRMAVSMAIAGVLQIVTTLPIVGWQSWQNWLQVGQEAAEEYRRQENWIFLSRDLLGLPRRWLLTYEGGLAKDLVWTTGEPSALAVGSAEKPWDHPLLTALCGGLWATVLAITLLVVWRSRRRRQELTGLFPAFLLTGAIFSCYHFLYYDFVVAGLPVLLLFTEPRRYFQVRFLNRSRDSQECMSSVMRRYYQPSLNDFTPPPMPLLPGGRGPHWVVAPVPPLLLALLLLAPPISYIIDPAYHFPPCDTLVLLILWAWCGFRLWKSANHGVTEYTERKNREKTESVTG
ncbi:MAG: glycosyltransferase family 87 protein [Gemmataceae bacterium]